MKKSDVTCFECGAGYRWIELTSRSGTKGEFRCLVCDNLLETFDGSRQVAQQCSRENIRKFLVGPWDVAIVPWLRNREVRLNRRVNRT